MKTYSHDSNFLLEAPAELAIEIAISVEVRLLAIWVSHSRG